MPRGNWAEAIYPVAQLFVERSLREGASFVTASPGVWTPDSAEDFYERFVINEDLSPASFLEKLERQLAGASEPTVLLAVDLMALCTIPVHDMSLNTKAKRFQTVLSLLDPAPEIDPAVHSAMTMGIAAYGQGNTQVWKFMRYLAEFARAWVKLDSSDKERRLADAWAWKEFLAGLLPGGLGAQGSALLHMVFPDDFEPIVSSSIKDAIGKTFARVPGVASEPDIDRKLMLVRSALTPMLGETFQFWDTPVQAVWQSKADDRSWTFAEFARKFRDLPIFDENEIDYKLELASRLAAAREAVLGGDAEWLEGLRHAFAAPNNITSWRQHDAFLKWCESSPDESRRALAGLWAAPAADEADLDSFLAAVPDAAIDSPGGRANVASYLCGAWDAQDWVNYKATGSDRALRLCGIEPAETHDVAERIARFRAFIDELRVRVVAIGGPATSRLEAQGMTWFVVGDYVPEEWTEPERATLAAFRSQFEEPIPEVAPLVERGDPTRPSPPLELPAVTAQVASRLFFNVEPLQEIVDLLGAKKQLVFYGPPGTGKTLVAKVLAEHLTATGGDWQLAQFHPSYSYEDFMEGYRPSASDDGSVTYELRQGPLRRIADEARDDPTNPYVLIVDEINRGNIPKIFGELLFLLEYRDTAIALQYSEEPFSLPPNLYLIGTMNTADRSIALVDAALRRRFYFVPFLPSEAPVKDVLRRWLEEGGHDELPALLLDELNRRIAKDEVAIGPSYFMGNDPSSRASLQRVWRHAILPLLDEHYYGTKVEVHKELSLEACLNAVRATTDANAPAENTPDEPTEESDA